MNVGEIMNSKVDCISADASVSEAIKIMASLDTDVLAVRKGGTLCGAISCRDIVFNVDARGKKPEETTVRNAMAPGMAYCFDDQDVAVPSAMMRNNVQHVLVLDGKHQLAGTVSMKDLASRFSDNVLTLQQMGKVVGP